MQTFPEWLAWLAAGGAGVIAFGLIEQLQAWAAFKRWWESIPAQFRRYIAFAVAGLIGAGGFALQVQLGYKAEPTTLTAWAEALFAIVASQVVHAIFKMRQA